MNNQLMMRLKVPALAALVFASSSVVVGARDLGPFQPHVGTEVTYAFSNKYGPDAEGTLRFDTVQRDGNRVSYWSSRGLNTTRYLRSADRLDAATFVLGYGERMPNVIPGSTTLGMSIATLEKLRATGRAPWTMIYDQKMRSIPGTLYLKGKTRLPLIIENDLRDVPAIHVVGEFREGDRTATADFYFHDDRKSPALIQRFIKMSWEKEPREERIVRITAGRELRSEMEQALSTLNRYDLYGLHFAFDKARLLPQSKQLLDDIAVTLKNNPLWSLRIVGHTDSIGDPAYNLKLSKQRAHSVAKALEQRGIKASRLTTAGAGETEPKASNQTLEGRAQNRRVQLIRTDR